MNKTFLTLFCLHCFYNCHAQNLFLPDTVLLDKFALYAKSNPDDVLFVHTDKSVYTNNEQIWFSAYLLQSHTTSVKEHTILSVALLREDNREIYMQDKYAMGGGLSFGSLLLPDSIPPGNYQLLVCTNVLSKSGRPAASFCQPLTIKSITLPDFDVRLSLLDSLPVEGAVRVRVLIEFNGTGTKSTGKPDVRYHVGNSKVKNARIDSQNACVLTIPVDQLNQPEPVLLTSVKVNDQVRHLSLRLPEMKAPGVTIRFYPEGGNLVDGLESTVGWETKTAANLPVPVLGVLFKNDLPVDTISTNSSGIGRFKLAADSKSKYHLLVWKNSLLPRDTIILLPEVLSGGVVLQLNKAVVKDTLALKLSASGSRKVQVLIHNYREVYASFLVDVIHQKRMLVALNSIPKGLATLTVLDEAGRPLAERLFFAHFDRRANVIIDKSKGVFTKREKVTLKFKLTDHIGAPLRGIVSVACVQDNRIDDLRQPDMASYAYLIAELTRLPPHASGRPLSDQDYLENMLLVKAWRRYTWQKLMAITPDDTTGVSGTVAISGNVRFNGKSLRKPVTLTLLKDGVFDAISTDKDGSFQITRDQLLITTGRKIFAMVNDKANPGHSIRLNDAFVTVNKSQAETTEIHSYAFAKNETSSRQFELKSFENAIVLKEVVIKATNDISLHRTVGANACGDYVCMNNILNCLNHYGSKHNTKPEKGRLYTGNIIYEGCTAEEGVAVFKLDGIYTAREFYGVDEKLLGFPDPQLLSTLFWRPGLLVSKEDGAECSFFTGDVTGKFRVVVQGMSDNDVIFGESSFEVK
jgi:hypothetical protein